MRKPVVDYTKLRPNNITSPQYKHLLLLLGWVFYLTMYFITENLIPEDKCHVIHSVVDDIIPFNEYFAIFYVSWYLFLAGSLLYFLLYDIKSFVHAQKLIVGMQIVAMATYVLWPSVQYLRPDHFERSNVFTFIMGLIYKADTPTGVCPSLHVGYTLAALSAWICRKETALLKKVLIGVWSFLICISVCFVKQHSFTDVWAAVVMYIFLMIIFYVEGKRRGKKKMG